MVICVKDIFNVGREGSMAYLKSNFRTMDFSIDVSIVKNSLAAIPGSSAMRSELFFFFFLASFFERVCHGWS